MGPGLLRRCLFRGDRKRLSVGELHQITHTHGVELLPIPDFYRDFMALRPLESDFEAGLSIAVIVAVTNWTFATSAAGLSPSFARSAAVERVAVRGRSF